MRISTFSTLVGIIIISNILITAGEYYNDQLIEDYENLSLLDYGNYSNYDYNSSEFDSLADQLEDHPLISSVGLVFSTFKNVFFGIPDLIQDVLTSAAYPVALVTLITLGIDAVFAVIYILFILQIISYFRGGGD